MDTAIVAAIIAALAGSGISSTMIFLIQRHDRKNEKKTVQSRMLMGLAHDRLLHLCEKYLEAGEIDADDYENLEKYLYEPYKELGGNGTVSRLMEKVKSLPVERERDED